MVSASVIRMVRYLGARRCDDVVEDERLGGAQSLLGNAGAAIQVLEVSVTLHVGAPAAQRDQRRGTRCGPRRRGRPAAACAVR
jgi:hypothetical protein